MINGRLPDGQQLRRTDLRPKKHDGRVKPYHHGAKRWAKAGEDYREAFEKKFIENESEARIEAAERAREARLVFDQIISGKIPPLVLSEKGQRVADASVNRCNPTLMARR